MRTKLFELTTIVELDEGGQYFAYCPDLKYAYASGKTIDEALENLKDVTILQKVAIKKEEFKIQSPVLVSRLQLAL